MLPYAVRDGGRAARPPARPRRARRRRRRGRRPRARRPPDPAASSSWRHRSARPRRSSVSRAHRVRRHHRARTPSGCSPGASYRVDPAAVDPVRRRVPRARRPRSPAPSSSPAEIPIGVVTAFFGAPFFVVVLRSAERCGDDAVIGARRRACRSPRRRGRSSTASTSRSPTGEWLAVVGPNGAGKTTLLRLVAGLVPRRPASCALDGRPATTLEPPGAGPARRPRRRRRRSIPAGMTVADYVLLGRTPHLRPLGVGGARRPRRGARRAGAPRPASSSPTGS